MFIIIKIEHKPSHCSHPTTQHSRTVTFTLLAPHNTAQSNSNLHTARTPQGSAPQPLPTTSSRTRAHTTCSNTRLVILKMGIMMPETC